MTRSHVPERKRGGGLSVHVLILAPCACIIETLPTLGRQGKMAYSIPIDASERPGVNGILHGCFNRSRILGPSPARRVRAHFVPVCAPVLVCEGVNSCARACRPGAVDRACRTPTSSCLGFERRDSVEVRHVHRSMRDPWQLLRTQSGSICWEVYQHAS